MTWLVAVSEFMRQPVALEALGDLDFLTYCPRYKERIIRRGRRTYQLRSLFGRYFFVMMSECWKKIFSARGVSHLMLGPEELPLLIHDDVIREIKAREVGGLIKVDHVRRGDFWRGQRVVPSSGHLIGMEGKFDKIIQRDQGDRMVALFDILGVETPVEFGPGILVASAFKEDRRRKNRNQRRSSFRKQEHGGEQVTHHARGV